MGYLFLILKGSSCQWELKGFLLTTLNIRRSTLNLAKQVFLFKMSCPGSLKIENSTFCVWKKKVTNAISIRNENTPKRKNLRTFYLSVYSKHLSIFFRSTLIHCMLCNCSVNIKEDFLESVKSIYQRET